MTLSSMDIEISFSTLFLHTICDMTQAIQALLIVLVVVLAIHHADSMPPGPTESDWLKLYFPTDLTVQELNDRRRDVCDNVRLYKKIVAAASEEEKTLNIIVMSDWERDDTEAYDSYVSYSCGISIRAGGFAATCISHDY
ncbi:hypothetical protein SeLEV6574_g07325 [Synchytrium endobioticum]|uniref:Uncharacterized protein n=1 Tax=Synchytrium endobioticum TaxID=286115 RepID=A0A507CI90_9FUNG|nr:hypothetical protein SeLEV6574_g07325 [Synchytrium endobioticum]